MKTTKKKSTNDDLPRRDEQASSNGAATASAVREGCAHTPGPWFALGHTVHPDRPSDLTSLTEIAACKHRRVGPLKISAQEAHANAVFIVRACNSHAELLAALKVAVETIRRWHGFGSPGTKAEAWALYRSSQEMRTITAALAKAEGR